MAKVDGSTLVAQALEKEGVKHIFSVPGGPIGEILAASTHYGIRPIGVRHEQAAVFASIGYAWVGNTVGVSVLAAGPAVTNGVTGAHVAWDNCIPAVIIGGAGPHRAHLTGTFQETDQVPMYRTVTKLATQVLTTTRIPEYIALAFRKARGGRPGPVYLDFPSDILSAEVEEEDVKWPSRGEEFRSGANPEHVKQAAELLLAAERPMMIVGKGARWSEPVAELTELATSLGMPFVASPMGRGVIPDDHPLNMNAARSSIMKNCDVALVVGARLNWMFDFGRAFQPDTRIIQIDIEPEEIGTNRPVDVGLVGDVGLVLDQLLGELRDKTGNMGDSAAEGPWLTALREDIKKNAAVLATVMDSDATPIHTHRLLKEIRDVFPRDTVYSVDGQTTLAAGRQVLPTFLPGSRLNSGGNGCMGVGVPFAIGAALARPGAPIVSVNGDCAFGFNGMEVGTAAQYRLPIVFIVNNNAGIVGSSFQSRMEVSEGYSDYISTYDPGFRYDLIGAAFGAHTENVTEPADILPAIERAYEASKLGRTSVVNVMSDPKDIGTMRATTGRASSLLGY